MKSIEIRFHMKNVILLKHENCSLGNVSVSGTHLFMKTALIQQAFHILVSFVGVTLKGLEALMELVIVFVRSVMKTEWCACHMPEAYTLRTDCLIAPWSVICTWRIPASLSHPNARAGPLQSAAEVLLPLFHLTSGAICFLLPILIIKNVSRISLGN